MLDYGLVLIEFNKMHQVGLNMKHLHWQHLGQYKAQINLIKKKPFSNLYHQKNAFKIQDGNHVQDMICLNKIIALTLFQNFGRFRIFLKI